MLYTFSHWHNIKVNKFIRGLTVLVKKYLNDAQTSTGGVFSTSNHNLLT